MSLVFCFPEKQKYLLSYLSYKLIFVLVFDCLLQKDCFYFHTNWPRKTPAQLFCFHADFSLGLFYIHSFLRTPPPLPHAHVYAPLLLLLLLWSDRKHCAHVPCPRVPITHFFSVCVLLGRIVFHVSSAQRRGVLQKVTRRKRICEWTPWCVPAHRSEGGGDLCRCTPERPLLRLTPHIPAPPLPPPVTMPLPPDEWGSRDISSVTMQGSHQILQLPVPFTTWKHVSPI